MVSHVGHSSATGEYSVSKYVGIENGESVEVGVVEAVVYLGDERLPGGRRGRRLHGEARVYVRQQMVVQVQRRQPAVGPVLAQLARAVRRRRRAVLRHQAVQLGYVEVKCSVIYWQHICNCILYIFL